MLAWIFPGNYDQISYSIVAEIVERGGNVYAETARYNYSPLWSFILVTLHQIPLPFHFSVRAFLTVVDVAIAFLLFRISERPAVAIVYLANPVTILLTGMHGQFENLAMLPLLVAVYLIERKPRLSAIWLLGVLSMLLKHITLFFVLFLFFKAAPTKRRAVLMMLAAGLVFLLSFLPYLPAGREGIIQNVFLYISRSSPEYGLASTPGWSAVPFMALMAAFALIASRRLAARDGLLFMALAYLTFAPGVSEQVFILPLTVSFAASMPYFLFTSAVAVFLTGSGNNLYFHAPIAWNWVWLVSLIWFSVLLIISLQIFPRFYDSVPHISISPKTK